MIGLDGTEIHAISRYKTFCNLCSRMIYKDEEILTWEGRQFIIHLDCSNPEVKRRMTNPEFRKNAKKRSGKRNLNKPNQYRKNWY